MTITALPDIALWHEVNQFYIREARLLDDLEFKTWVDLFTDDCSYWAPIVSNRIGRESQTNATRMGSAYSHGSAWLVLAFVSSPTFTSVNVTAARPRP